MLQVQLPARPTSAWHAEPRAFLCCYLVLRPPRYEQEVQPWLQPHVHVCVSACACVCIYIYPKSIHTRFIKGTAVLEDVILIQEPNKTNLFH